MSEKLLGIIGLGLLGSALADRLLAAGYSLFGYDIHADRRAEFTSLGGTATDSSDSVAQQCRCILLSLPNSTIAKAVVAELGPHLAPGTLIIDTTTGDPNDSCEIAAQLADQNVSYVDATIVGSSTQVRSGDCIVLMGGEESPMLPAKEVCQHFARQIFHVGPVGHGAQMKLVVNLVLGLNRAVLAEGLSFAQSLGLDLQQTLEILTASAAYSRVMDTKGQKMLAQDFTAQARLAQHAKDVDLILAAGLEAGAALPLSTVHAELLAALLNRGWGEADNSAIIKVFEGVPSSLERPCAD